MNNEHELFRNKIDEPITDIVLHSFTAGNSDVCTCTTYILLGRDRDDSTLRNLEKTIYPWSSRTACRAFSPQGFTGKSRERVIVTKKGVATRFPIGKWSRSFKLVSKKIEKHVAVCE